MSLFVYTSKALKYYNSIEDLPLKNWFKIQKTNDIVWLLHKQIKVSIKQKIQLDRAFYIIWKEFINTFGISDAMQKILELRRDIQVLKSDMYLRKDRSRLGLIRVKERELKSLTDDTNKKEFDNTQAYVAKFMGFKIDENTTTVKEYYGYMEIMKQAIKEAEKNSADVGQD